MAYNKSYPFTKSLTFYIIAINVIVWIAQLVAYPLIDDAFSLGPGIPSGQSYQFLTYMFLHATYAETSSGGLSIYPSHIAMNMLVLAIFGVPLERAIGRKKFISLYLVSGVGSAVFFIYVTSMLAAASGAGLIGASARCSG